MQTCSVELHTHRKRGFDDVTAWLAKRHDTKLNADAHDGTWGDRVGAAVVGVVGDDVGESVGGGGRNTNITLTPSEVHPVDPASSADATSAR